MTLGLAFTAFGCIVEADPDPDPRGMRCGGNTCSQGALCIEGACVCKEGLLGDPYARYGCQPPAGALCPTTCGLNAYCAPQGECVCAEGFVAVCGTGDCLAETRLCDGVPDCLDGQDEEPSLCSTEIQQAWTVVDDCNDGVDVQWRLWSSDGAWVWPGPDDVFWTVCYGYVSFKRILCLEGETICLGAQVGSAVWGVGLDGAAPCEACCSACGLERVDFGWLACP